VTTIALVGIVLSHTSHILSMLVLYALIRRLASLSSVSVPIQRRLAFLSASLHVLSPAGIFLSAPYAEASFALASFAGYYCYVASWTGNSSHNRSWSLVTDVWTVAAGVCFAVATLFRSNGLFCGLIFAYDAFLWALNISSHVSLRWIVPLVAISGAVLAVVASQQLSYDVNSVGQLAAGILFTLLPVSIMYNQSHRLQGVFKILKTDLDSRPRASIIATIISGLCIGVSFVWPQYVAYQEYCVSNSDDQSVPWCTDMPPSIYTSIQARYW